MIVPPLELRSLGSALDLLGMETVWRLLPHNRETVPSAGDDGQDQVSDAGPCGSAPPGKRNGTWYPGMRSAASKDWRRALRVLRKQYERCRLKKREELIDVTEVGGW